MRRFVTEFIGTFFLVLTIVLVVTAGEPVAALAIGSALMVMVYMGGHVSGAHYNPAVTLAVYLARKLPAADVAPYMLSQVAGGLVAALIGFWLAGQTFAPAPGPSATLMQALAAEALFTFALALVVLNTAASRDTQGNSYFGLAIGFTVAVGAFAAGPISGGAFNPAVGLGPILASVFAGAGLSPYLWIYLVGPFAGGAAAAAVFALQEAVAPAPAAAQAAPAPPAAP